MIGVKDYRIMERLTGSIDLPVSNVRIADDPAFRLHNQEERRCSFAFSLVRFLSGACEEAIRPSAHASFLKAADPGPMARVGADQRPVVRKEDDCAN